MRAPHKHGEPTVTVTPAADPNARPERVRPYVVATGSIAAGASTISERLIDRLGWKGHLEGHVEVDNPFFGDANSEFGRWGFHSQVHFLLASIHRHDALAAALAEVNLAAPAIVEDRTPFEHTGAYLETYARLGRLSEREAELLRELTVVLERSYLVPDLVIYRELADDQLRGRVVARGREGETQDLELLCALRDSFNEFIAGWDRSPKIIVPADVDVLDNTVFERIVEQVTHALSRN